MPRDKEFQRFPCAAELVNGVEKVWKQACVAQGGVDLAVIERKTSPLLVLVLRQMGLVQQSGASRCSNAAARVSANARTIWPAVIGRRGL